MVIAFSELDVTRKERVDDVGVFFQYLQTGRHERLGTGAIGLCKRTGRLENAKLWQQQF